MFQQHRDHHPVPDATLPGHQHHLAPLEIVVKKLTPDQLAVSEMLIAEVSATRGLAQELALRGVTSLEEYRTFLTPRLEDLPPWQALKGAPEAVSRILAAVAGHEKIGLYCDYDVDGTTSGAILSYVLRQLDTPPLLLTPDRFTDGYGLNNRLIQRAHEEGVSLLVTLDSGTHSEKEVAFAHSLGMEVIVVDHHHVPKGVDPGAEVFINPKREACGFADGILCTAGLSWMIAQGISESAPRFDPRKLLPYVALATICDVVPLRGANRVLTSIGLSEWKGGLFDDIPALALLRERGSSLDAHSLGFKIGPLINAGGRSDHGGGGRGSSGSSIPHGRVESRSDPPFGRIE